MHTLIHTTGQFEQPGDLNGMFLGSGRQSDETHTGIAENT